MPRPTQLQWPYCKYRKCKQPLFLCFLSIEPCLMLKRKWFLCSCVELWRTHPTRHNCLKPYSSDKFFKLHHRIGSQDWILKCLNLELATLKKEQFENLTRRIRPQSYKHNGIKPLFDCKLVLFRKFGYYQAFFGITNHFRFYQEVQVLPGVQALPGIFGITRHFRFYH